MFLVQLTDWEEHYTVTQNGLKLEVSTQVVFRLSVSFYLGAVHLLRNNISGLSGPPPPSVAVCQHLAYPPYPHMV